MGCRGLRIAHLSEGFSNAILFLATEWSSLPADVGVVLGSKLCCGVVDDGVALIWTVRRLWKPTTCRALRCRHEIHTCCSAWRRMLCRKIDVWPMETIPKCLSCTFPTIRFTTA